VRTDRSIDHAMGFSIFYRDWDDGSVNDDGFRISGKLVSCNFYGH
jgi:hypothetical protein